MKEGIFVHKSWHIGTFTLIMLNVLFGFLLFIHHFDSHVIYIWGGSTGTPPGIQSLSEFPPFCFLHLHGKLFLTALSGPTLIILRALYASFIHFSIVHLSSNMFALYELGYMFEDLNYPGLIIPIYCITGIISMLTANHFSPNNLTCGASGAIFGLMGIMISMGVKAYIESNLNHLDSQTSMNYTNFSGPVFMSVLINLVVTFTTPNISIAAHVGGLLSGLILGIVIPIRKAE